MNDFKEFDDTNVAINYILDKLIFMTKNNQLIWLAEFNNESEHWIYTAHITVYKSYIDKEEITDYSINVVYNCISDNKNLYIYVNNETDVISLSSNNTSELICDLIEELYTCIINRTQLEAYEHERQLKHLNNIAFALF